MSTTTEAIPLTPEFKARAAEYGMVPRELAIRLLDRFTADEREEITIRRRISPRKARQ